MPSTLSPGPLQEFLAIVRRDLGTEDARIVRAEDAQSVSAQAGAYIRDLPADHRLILCFSPIPDDIDARLRRLDMLLSSFSEMLADKLSSQSSTASAHRAVPAESLHEELAALAMRASAIDALVIDAHSPVVWGAAVEEPIADTQAETPPERGASVLSLELERARRKSALAAERKSAPGWVEPPAPPDAMPHTPTRESLSARALERVRALPEMATLPKGGHLRMSVSEAEFGFAAHSFAGIYVLILVFRGDTPLDELRVKRAIVHALPVIERLVLALPPLDPVPMAGVASISRRRRRR